MLWTKKQKQTKAAFQKRKGIHAVPKRKARTETDEGKKEREPTWQRGKMPLLLAVVKTREPSHNNNNNNNNNNNRGNNRGNKRW